MFNNKRQILGIFLPLLIGFVIYGIGSRDIFFIQALKLFNTTNIIYKILRFWITDFLWAISLSFALLAVNNTKHNLLIVTALGFLLEILQFFHLINGTADLLDVAMEILGVLLVKLITKEKDERNAQ